MKVLLFALLLVQIFSFSAEGQGWQSGLSLSNYGFGLGLIEYVSKSGLSFFVDSQIKDEGEQGYVRLGSRYYFDFSEFKPFGSIAFNHYTVDSPENYEYEVDEIGAFFGGGLAYELGFLSGKVEVGYGSADPDSFYAGGAIKFSWTDFFRMRREDKEEWQQGFFKRHPDLTSETKKYIRQNRLGPRDPRVVYVEENPKMNSQEKNWLLQGKIWLGMSKEKARVVLGEPNNINTTVTAHSKREQWVYGQIENRRYYYFEDGELTSWQY